MNDEGFKSQKAIVEKRRQEEIDAAKKVLESINSNIDSSNSSVSHSRKANFLVHWDKFDYDWSKNNKLQTE